MANNTRRFQCETCGAKEFDITVEPNYPATDENEQWLKDVSYCPACGSDVTEV